MTERGEKIMDICFLVVGYGLVVPVAFFGIVMLLGLVTDNWGEYDRQHDNCLKHAANGYEIRECH